MTEAKTNPREKPKIILQTIKPRATKPPIERTPLMKEKSFRVMKTVAVIPSTSNKVINPAVGISPLPPYMVAIKRRGKKTPQGEMSFLEHLEELRWHIIRSVVFISVF